MPWDMPVEAWEVKRIRVLLHILPHILPSFGIFKWRAWIAWNFRKETPEKPCVDFSNRKCLHVPIASHQMLKLLRWTMSSRHIASWSASHQFPSSCRFSNTSPLDHFCTVLLRMFLPEDAQVVLAPTRKLGDERYCDFSMSTAAPIAGVCI